MSKLSNVWVFCDAASRYPDVIAGATQLGEKVSVFILGTESDAAKAFSYGATSVYWLGEKDESKIVEDYVQTMAQTIASNEQPALVLLAATRSGKAVAAKLSILLKAGVVNDATEIKLEEGVIKAQHMVYGGLAYGQEAVKSPVAIVTVGAGMFEAQPPIERTGDIIHVAFVASPSDGIKCLERRPKEGVSVDLVKASRVVAVGRGIAAQEDIKLAEDLCSVLGAELGCSRPIAEGEKWLEKDRYIGVSGVMLKPDVYLALGVSGQIQHMVGVNNAQTIIAVNKDKNAPIFQFADYGLVGDLYKVVPALIKALS